MSGNCFKLRHFNLPARFDDVLRRLAGVKGEICEGDGADTGFLPYSGPFADLSVDDYLKLQSDFMSKRLIWALHSPDQVRFAKEGLSDYIADPQKRRTFVAEMDTAGLFVDNAKCAWDKAFTFPSLHSDDTLVQKQWDIWGSEPPEYCGASNETVWKSFAQYYGLTSAQRLDFENAFSCDAVGYYMKQEIIDRFHSPADDSDHNEEKCRSVLAMRRVEALDILVGNAGRSIVGAIHFAQLHTDRILLLGSYNLAGLITLSKYGISDADLDKFGSTYSNDFAFLEPLFLELRELGFADPREIIKKTKTSSMLFQALTTMRVNGYTDDEMRWVAGHYPLIDRVHAASDLANIFSHARQEKVSFQEIRWILEDGVGLKDYTLYKLFVAYCNSPERSRETVYKLVEDEVLIGAYSIDIGEVQAGRFQADFADKHFCEVFAKRLGLQPEQTAIFIATTSPVMRGHILKYRAGATIFDPQKIGEYKAIARDLHNRGEGDLGFFRRLSFEYYVLQSPPRSLLEAAKVFRMLENVHIDMSKNYFENVVCREWSRLSKDYQAWYNSKTGRLDVTRHNIKDVNGMLALFERPTLDFSEEAEWFISHLDVEEIDLRNLPPEVMADFFELMKRLRNVNATASGHYLSDQLLNLDARKVFAAIDVVDIAKIEVLRRSSNGGYPHLGDQLVDNLGIAMLENIESSVFNVAELQRVARAWSLNGNNDVLNDDRGLYQQYSSFAYQMISDVLLGTTGNWHDEDRVENLKTFLAGRGVDLEELVDELEREGFPIRTESDWDKFKNRIATDPGYVFRRGAQKVLPDALQANNMSGLKAVPSADWASRNGVAILVVRNADDKEIARAIRCDRNVMGVEILLNAHALVNTEKRKQELGARYVFSAPLNMTTPDARTMTEIAYDRGEPMNWLMTARGKDGLLLVGTDQAPHILDKRGIKLSEMISAADLPALKDDLHVWKKRRKLEALSDDAVLNAVIRPFNHLADKVLFRVIMERKSYSLLSGMLFTAGENAHRLKQEGGAASRRLFVEYADGRFGVVDGTEYLTTEKAFEAAKAAGATKAIYMDTGFWDQADYVDGKGESHRLDPGHSNSSESTNRVIIRVK